MKHKIVTYTAKPDKIEEVKKLVNQFVEYVKENEPETLVYECYQDKKDSSSFIQFMTFLSEEAEERHKNSGQCRRFVELLYGNLVEEPEFGDVNLVKSNRD
ncbi:hypothetical protein GF386_03460 [Candidatus Pacearchaeota archaeon]|nr:hypothetical protein [Candidatus Pacearchaeota archaeon]MBD3283199.1 hypothetical protein [Candidatus Pacearchaeota archaeon]